MKGRDSAGGYPESIQRKVRAAALSGSKTPVELDEEELRALGHVKRSAARAIRAMCIDCFGGTSPQHCKADIAGCTSVGCPLWPFRFGTSPFHGKEATS
jgi:hypothetical protein